MDTFKDEVYNAISESRSIPLDKLKDLFKTVSFGSKEALEHKLVDGLGYEYEGKIVKIAQSVSD